MSIKQLPIYNSQSFPNNTLTVTQANQLFYQKNATNLIVKGSETVNSNETVYGSMTCGTATVTNSITAGQTNSNHSLTGTLVLANTFSATPSSISLTLLPRLQSNIAPTDTKDLVPKLYVDNLISTNIIPTLSDTVIYGQQTNTTPSGTSNNFNPPKCGQTPVDVYINFPPSVLDTATGNIVTSLYAPFAMFDFNYVFNQCGAISTNFITVTGSGSAATYSYTDTSTPNMIVGQFATGNPSTCINAKFNISLKNNNVIATAPVQTTTIWNNPSGGNGTPKNVSCVMGTTSFSVPAIQFTWYNATKAKITITMPIIHQSTTSNNPSLAGWIDSCGFSIKLLESAPYKSSTKISALTTLTPSLSTTTNTGGAWLSLT